jgi:DnaJ-class molecular chaperone
MEFGKRLPVDHPDRKSEPAQETCVRCCGTGHVRERGNRFRCKICGGSGRVTVVTEPEPKAASAA